MVDFVEHRTTDDVLAAFDLPEWLSRHVHFDHGAVVVFPRSLPGAVAYLRARGLFVGPMLPSVIVARRLAERYRLSLDSLDVRIVHATPGDHEGADGDIRTVEIFLSPGNWSGPLKIA
jgi:hypothetical protein